MAEYNQYRNQQRAVCKGITAKGREDRQQTLARLKQRKKEIRALEQPWPAKKILLSEAVAASVIELRTLKLSTQNTRQHLMVSLRQRKKEIRASALSWPDKKVLLSQAAAQTVIEVRALKRAVQQRRQEAFPQNLRTWVAERAAEGDARAAAQLRGWRYADQRNQRRLDARLEANAMHIGPPPDHDGSADWADLAQQRLASQQREQALANQISATRIWTINRKTGDVSYVLNGQVSVIDRGRIVTVLNQDKAAVLFGLEMAVQKYGSRIACDGSVEWKRMVTKVAAQQGISVQFTDPEMLHALRFLQRLANPRQRQQERGGR